MPKALRLLSTACAALAFVAGTAAHGQETDGENCQIHIWAAGYVPSADAAPSGNSLLVRMEPPNYADPLSSASLLDARQRLSEIDPVGMLDAFGLGEEYEVILHPEGFVSPDVIEGAETRLSNTPSDCYIDFGLFGRSHTAGKRSFYYRWYFNDFASDAVANLRVKGGRSADLFGPDEDEGINTVSATAFIIEKAGEKIERRRRR